MIPVEAVKKLLPKSHRTLMTQEFLDKVEASIKDPLIAESFKDNFISYLNVLSTGKYKMEDYISAVKYVSYKLLGYTDIKAYAATFPERYQRVINKEKDQIYCFVSMYNKNKLVVSIYEQTIVPTYILNAPLHQEALSELAKMIKDPSVRGMAKVKACEAILQYTKQPDIVKGELTIGVEQSETIADLRDATEKLAEMYKGYLEKGGMNLKQVAESNIIDVEVSENE